jgi:hypothetical protein
MRNILIVVCVGLSACAHTALPDDVLHFAEQRDACDHFRGEFPDPPDPERTAEVLKMVAEFCTGTDVRLAELRARHYANASAMKRLSEYDAVIEKKRK